MRTRTETLMRQIIAALPDGDTVHLTLVGQQNYGIPNQWGARAGTRIYRADTPEGALESLWDYVCRERAGLEIIEANKAAFHTAPVLDLTRTSW